MLHLLPKRQNAARLACTRASLRGVGGYLHFLSSGLKLLTARQLWGSVGLSAWTFLLGRGWSECTGMAGKWEETGVWVSVHVWNFTITPKLASNRCWPCHSWLQRACISSPCFLTTLGIHQLTLLRWLRTLFFGSPHAPGFYSVSIIMNSVAL